MGTGLGGTGAGKPGGVEGGEGLWKGGGVSGQRKEEGGGGNGECVSKLP